MGLFGWTLSDGVDTETAVVAGDGNIYDAVDTKDSASWGFGAGLHVNDRFEVGFLFNQQMSTLAVDGNQLDRSGGPQRVFFITRMSPSTSARRGHASVPYLLIGMGATHFSSVDFNALGADRQIPRPDAVLHDVGSRREGVSVTAFRCALRDAVDTHLHQDRRRGLVVRSVLGLLPHRRSAASNQFQFSGGLTTRF